MTEGNGNLVMPVTGFSEFGAKNVILPETLVLGSLNVFPLGNKFLQSAVFLY